MGKQNSVFSCFFYICLALFFIQISGSRHMLLDVSTALNSTVIQGNSSLTSSGGSTNTTGNINVGNLVSVGGNVATNGTSTTASGDVNVGDLVSVGGTVTSNGKSTTVSGNNKVLNVTSGVGQVSTNNGSITTNGTLQGTQGPIITVTLSGTPS